MLLGCDLRTLIQNSLSSLVLLLLQNSVTALYGSVGTIRAGFAANVVGELKKKNAISTVTHVNLFLSDAIVFFLVLGDAEGALHD